VTRFLWITLLLVPLLLMGCRQTDTGQPEAGLDIRLDAAPDPAEVGEATLLIAISDGSGNPVTGATVDVRGDMTHAGMVPVIREDISSDENGLYDVPFEWTMGGDWLIEVTATLPDGSTTTERFEYTVGIPDNAPDEMQDMNATPTAGTDA
jgi:hypothetical protein